MAGSHPGASRATPLASSQPQLNHLLRAFTRTPTARIRRAIEVKTSLTFRAVTLPLRTSARRPLGLDTALTSSRLLPPRQRHDCSGRRCHGRHHPSCQRAPAALLGLHNTEIPRQDSRPCGHRRRRYPSRAFRSPKRSDGRGHSMRPGTFLCGRGHSTPSGTFDAVGDRIAVPLRAACPRPGESAPPRAGCPRPREGCDVDSAERRARDSRVVRLARAGRRRRRAVRRSR